MSAATHHSHSCERRSSPSPPPPAQRNSKAAYMTHNAVWRPPYAGGGGINKRRDTLQAKICQILFLSRVGGCTYWDLPDRDQ